MNATTKVKLSLMMFLEFLIWGSWFVPMGTYLGSLGFTGGQIGYAYLTMAIAAIISPIFVGMVADKFFPAQRLLGVLHLVGAVLMFWVSTITSPLLFFWALLAYALCYMPTLALVNAIAFSQMQDTEKEFPVIRAVGTLGWIVVGLVVGFVAIGGASMEPTNIPMYIAAVASLVLGIFSFFLPHTPPKSAGKKITVGDILGVEALRLMKDQYFTVFVVASLLISMTTSFYFNFANLYFNESGMQYTAAKMTGGQFSEAIFIALLAFFFAKMGIKTILVTGMLAWSLRYFMLAYGDSDSLIFLWYIAILIHGLCFGFFFIAGQVYVEKVAPKVIQASAQGFIALVTFGIGHALGAQFSGFIVDMYSEMGAAGEVLARNWQAIWLVPAVIALVVGVLFALLFKVKPAEIPVEAPAE